MIRNLNTLYPLIPLLPGTWMRPNNKKINKGEEFVSWIQRGHIAHTFFTSLKGNLFRLLRLISTWKTHLSNAFLSSLGSLRWSAQYRNGRPRLSPFSSSLPWADHLSPIIWPGRSLISSTRASVAIPREIIIVLSAFGWEGLFLPISSNDGSILFSTKSIFLRPAATIMLAYGRNTRRDTSRKFTGFICSKWKCFHAIANWTDDSEFELQLCHVRSARLV